MKKKMKPLEGLQMMDHGPTVLIGVRDEAHNRLNLFAVAWIIPCSAKPPLVVTSVNPKNLSHELIKNTQEFTVNIPNVSLLDKLHFCGTTSGRSVDKVEKLSLTPVKAQRVSTPLIEECIGHLECKVIETKVIGDHTLFTAEVLAASADDDFFDGSWRFERSIVRTLHYLGGRRYAAIGEVLEAKTAR